MMLGRIDEDHPFNRLIALYKKLALTIFVLLSTVSPSRSSDNSDFSSILANNSGGRYCVNLNRMITHSFTLDLSDIIHFALWYQADCIWQSVTTNATQYPNFGQAILGFQDFMGRERQLYFLQHGDRVHGFKDNGIYGQWMPTLTNALSAGLIGNVSIPDVSALLGYVGGYCKSVDPIGVGDVIAYLVQHGANPDQAVTIMGVRSGTPRQIIKRNCPSLENRL